MVITVYRWTICWPKLQTREGKNEDTTTTKDLSPKPVAYEFFPLLLQAVKSSKFIWECHSFLSPETNFDLFHSSRGSNIFLTKQITLFHSKWWIGKNMEAQTQNDTFSSPLHPKQRQYWINYHLVVWSEALLCIYWRHIGQWYATVLFNKKRKRKQVHKYLSIHKSKSAFSNFLSLKWLRIIMWELRWTERLQ